jgi:hypothetical protein
MNNASKDNDHPVTQSDDGSVIDVDLTAGYADLTVQARMQTKSQRKVQATISVLILWVMRQMMLRKRLQKWFP